MFLTYLTLFVALCLSAIAAFYSIVGLTAIFAAAVIPIVIMGTVLEVAKLVVTVWLHEYWRQCKLTMKLYLVPAVGVLMLITSMGIFGFLSKAHLDQAVPVGDVAAKLAIYDEKIKTSRENIDAARTALKQLDAAVDQTLARSSSETGADRAVQIRRQQGPERQRLIREIEAEQKKISALNEERAPIAAEVRKVEAEVGPIKYVAALIYGDNPDANLLEKAVRWVIIILVIVFDPLAVMMLLAATESRRWMKDQQSQIQPTDDTDNKQSPDRETLAEPLAPFYPSEPPNWEFRQQPSQYPSTESEIEELMAELDRVRAAMNPPATTTHVAQADDDQDNDIRHDDHDEAHEEKDPRLKAAQAAWKLDNPGKTLKEQRHLLERGTIDRLPWEDYITKAQITSFGKDFPLNPIKGDLFLNTQFLPTKLYKFNGASWIEIDKNNTDQYSYNSAYIDYLIDSIGEGTYDLDLLTDSERQAIETKLNKNI